ncbi:MAG: UbiA family prenyltransferase [Candidatus Hadarchaeales archaeon]
MKRLAALWQLLRLDHDVMLAAGVVIGYAISGGLLLQNVWHLTLASLTAFFVGAGAFALNDYMDIEIDRRNRRMDRPLVRGDLSPRTALGAFLVLVPAGLACSLLVNFICFFIALITAAFAVFYDVWVKKLKLIGNFYIAYMMAIPFVFGGVAVSSVPPSTVILSIMAYLSGLGREVMKDIIDLPGDREAGVRSFPSMLGEGRSRVLSSVTFLAAALLSPIPFVFGPEPYLMNPFYLVPVAIAAIIFIFVAFSMVTRPGQSVAPYRRMTLIGMLIGLLGFLLGSCLSA